MEGAWRQSRLRSRAMSPIAATTVPRMMIAASMKVRDPTPCGRERGRPHPRCRPKVFVHMLHLASSWSSWTISRSRSRFFVTVAV